VVCKTQRLFPVELHPDAPVVFLCTYRQVCVLFGKDHRLSHCSFGSTDYKRTSTKPSQTPTFRTKTYTLDTTVLVLTKKTTIDWIIHYRSFDNSRLGKCPAGDLMRGITLILIIFPFLQTGHSSGSKPVSRFTLSALDSLSVGQSNCSMSGFSLGTNCKPWLRMVVG
jgi:hypothetical protein